MREPRLFQQPLGLVGLDLVFVPQGQADVVKTVEHAELAECLDFKRPRLAVGLDHDLSFQVHGEFVADTRSDIIKQAVDLSRGQHDGQQAVLETVVEEDVREARGDQRTKTVLIQRPRRVLARRSAAEVLSGDQHRCSPIARLVQHEVGVGCARGRVLARKPRIQVTPRIEQVLAKA